MAPQPETRLHRAIQERLKRDFGAHVWCVKFHASGWTRKGIPDLLVCARGAFIGLEVKTPNGRVSPDQTRELTAIDAAGGTAAVVTSPAQASEVVRLALLEAVAP